jgi:hypothetical protein
MNVRLTITSISGSSLFQERPKDTIILMEEVVAIMEDITTTSVKTAFKVEIKEKFHSTLPKLQQ